MRAVVEPLLQGVLVREVAVGRGAHGLRRRQADALPFETAVEAPAQNGRPLGFELARQDRCRARSRGISTVNGTSSRRRRMASSTLRRRGLWLPTMKSLKVGSKSK